MREALIEAGHTVSVLTFDAAMRPNGSVFHYPVRGLLRRAMTKASDMLAPRRHSLHWRNLLAERLAYAQRVLGFEILEIEESFGIGELLKLNIPVVVRMHGPHYRCKDPSDNDVVGPEDRIRIEAEGRAIKAADAVTSPTRIMLDEVAEYYQAKLPVSDVIPNPVKRRQANLKWSLERCDRDQILAIGRFDLLKGADLAIAAFEMVIERHPNAKLVLVGPGKGLPDGKGSFLDFATYVDRHVGAAAAARITYAGIKSPDEVAALRMQSRMALVTSRFESFPYVLAEALGAGMPSVSTDTPGAVEMIEDRVSGLLARSENVGSIADAISELLHSDQLCLALADGAYRRATKLLDPQVIAAQTISFYSAVVARRHTQSARSHATAH